MALGDKIKEARKRNGLTQRQLAELINAKHNSISNWENNQNKPDPDTIELLCGVLNVSPSWLLNSSIETKISKVDKRKENLIKFYDELNDIGKSKLLERAEELTYIPKYTNTNITVLNAAHAIDGATEEELQHDNDIMDDDDFWR